MRKLCLMAFALIFSLAACTKIETTTIGAGLIPPIDGVTTLDTTLDVITANYLDTVALTSLKTYKSQDQILGIIQDPLFGKTTASAYLELKPPSYPFKFPATSTLTADSAYLILGFHGAYGDTANHQTWVVKELSDTLRGDTIYTVNTTFSTSNVLAMQMMDVSTFNDPINTRLETANNQIRIKLSNAFAQRLIKNDSTIYGNDTLFRNAFKGFAVVPTGSGNALIKFNLLDTNTKLALYYTYKPNDDAAATRDTAVTFFRFSQGSTTRISGAANNINRDYTGSQFKSALTNPQLNDSLVFIQTSPGTYASIQIPGLSRFPNSIIHRAELLLFEEPEAIGLRPVLPAPSFLLLSAYDTAHNVKVNVPNDFVVNTAYGTFNTATFGGYPADISVAGYGAITSYKYNVSRYVQGIVTRSEPNYTLILSAPSNDSLKYKDPYPSTFPAVSVFLSPYNANTTAIGQVRLAGRRLNPNSPIRMRLRIIYSKI